MGVRGGFERYTRTRRRIKLIGVAMALFMLVAGGASLLVQMQRSREYDEHMRARVPPAGPGAR